VNAENIDPTDANTNAANASAAAIGGATPKIAFIHACYSASSVRNRMLFITYVCGLVRAAEERCGVKITEKVCLYLLPLSPFLSFR
jgi:hypothetical protein